MSKTIKKLVSTLTTFLLIAEVSIKEILRLLNWVLYAWYLIYFEKNRIQAFFDLSSEINTMTLILISKLGFKIWYINIRTPKINNFILKIFKITLASF